MCPKNNNKEAQDSIKFFNHFIEFISDYSDNSDLEIDNELQSQGVDIDNLLHEAQDIVNSAIEKERLAWQKDARESRTSNLKKLAEKTADFTQFSRNDLLIRIKSFADALEPDFSFAHRNLKLEDMSEDELRDILSEYEQLADE